MGDSSVTIPLDKDLYWWRVYPASNIRRESLSLYPSGVILVDECGK
jgi:hypothetical protein